MDFFSVEALKGMVMEYAPLVVGAILTLVIGFWIAGVITRSVKRVMEKRDLDPSLRPFFASLVNISLKVLVLISAAGMFGFEVTSFIAILGAAAFAIGMALQGTLGHLASGVLILSFRPYRVGDFVIMQGYSGTVKEILLFNTILTTLDNRIVIVPNGAVTSGPIENLTVTGERQLDMTFGIGYSDDIDKARQVINSVVDECPGYMKDRGVNILVKELADSSVNFAVRFWTTTGDYWPAFFHMQEHIKKAFDKEGVNIPFPQMDVHVQKDS
jgi:small conductance mechanosensitive channel